METKNGRKKPTIELRYYELPEHEPALALLGPEWQRVYGTEPEDLHFHNLMEIGLCQWGEGTLIVDETRYIYHGGGNYFDPLQLSAHHHQPGSQSQPVGISVCGPQTGAGKGVSK